jgi:GT2 family glycosyltransferase
MGAANGEYVVTIDDDILGFEMRFLEYLRKLFEDNIRLGAVCFKVVDFYTGSICNWCHPRSPDAYANIQFETCEITEGAVGFRKSVLREIGLYPEEFFISHEGADMVARMLNHGYEILYCPSIAVRHKYAKEGRPSWRRYYYDTRNDIWLAVRNYRIVSALKHLLRRLPVTLIYSIRDGFFRYWIKAVWDGVSQASKIAENSLTMSVTAQKRLHALNKGRPGLVYFLKNRLFVRRIKI